MSEVPAGIADFLYAPTPRAWLVAARDNLGGLLLDHANCEMKAASTAIGLIYRYPERDNMVHRMSRLAREELRHFEQVRGLMTGFAVPYRKLSASRYAATLRQAVDADEPLRLTDTLLVGAIIEARSCERFALLVPLLPKPLAAFYAGLLASEARHFEHYLGFAKTEGINAGIDVDERLALFLELESALVLEPDPQFRFHSGPPA